MTRFLPGVLLAFLLATPAITNAQSAPASPNYASPTAWVCRPGTESACTANLDATVVSADGHKTVDHFAPAANPPIDCFYVYPTVSHEQTPLSDLSDSPEVQQVANAQAGRLTSRCRLFAPIYRQVTLTGLRQHLTTGSPIDTVTPLQDVQAAWTYYLRHDNHGRGVVLIGHSQGTMILQQLIATSIDGTPAQSLLVSAFLAGDPSLGVPPGKSSGGTFAHIPVCSAAAQTGCVYVWGSYRAQDTSANQVFGKTRADGLVSACKNPAAPSGGSGPLKFFYQNHDSDSATDPLWIETIGQLSGSCNATAEGNAFRISVQPASIADYYNTLLQRAEFSPGWGLHILDLTLVQGNILDVLDAEITTWKRS